jgi:glyoxylate/hydroxypyruvate reductase
MSILVQVTGWDPEPWAVMFRTLAPNRPVFTGVDDANRATIRYAMVWKPAPGLLGQLPNLAAIFNLGAGVDAILADTSIPPHIPIVRGVDANLTMRMVEWVTLHVLLHHRQMLFYRDRQAEQRWAERVQPAAAEVTVGILGLGTLGIAAATTLKQIGFRLAGWSRSAKTVPGIDCFAGAHGLDPFLAQTDILVCLLPLTSETKGILNAGLFAKLKRNGPLGGPVVINAGRGGEQVETDILAALDQGTLAGVSLDVFEQEPLPANSPLWRHPRAILTPHNAADSDPRSICAHVLTRIADIEAGRPLAPVVDRARGY